MPLFDVKVPIMGYRLFQDVDAVDEEAAIKHCLEHKEVELVLDPDEDGHIALVKDTDTARLDSEDNYPCNPSAEESYAEDDAEDLGLPG